MTDVLLTFALIYVAVGAFCLLAIAAQGPTALRGKWKLALVWPYFSAIGFKQVFNDLRRNWR